MIVFEYGSHIDEHGKVFSCVRAYDTISEKALIPNQTVLGTMHAENGTLKRFIAGIYKFGYYKTPTGVEGVGAYVENGDRQLPLTGNLLDCIII